MLAGALPAARRRSSLPSPPPPAPTFPTSASSSTNPLPHRSSPTSPRASTTSTTTPPLTPHGSHHVQLWFLHQHLLLRSRDSLRLDLDESTGHSPRLIHGTTCYMEPEVVAGGRISDVFEVLLNLLVYYGEVEQGGQSECAGGEEEVGREGELGGDVEGVCAEEVENESANLGGLGEGPEELTEVEVGGAEEGKDVEEAGLGRSRGR